LGGPWRKKAETLQKLIGKQALVSFLISFENFISFDFEMLGKCMELGFVNFGWDLRGLR